MIDCTMEGAGVLRRLSSLFRDEEDEATTSSQVELNQIPLVGSEVFVELAAAREVINNQQAQILISKQSRITQMVSKLRSLPASEVVVPAEVPVAVSVAVAGHQVVDVEQLLNSINCKALNKPLIRLEFSDLTYTVYKRRKSRWRKFLGRSDEASTDITANGVSDMTSAASAAAANDIEARNLLEGVSGEARDGEILAVMGPSGSGKSTLIDALALRIAKGSLRGKVTLNGEVVSNRLLRTISAYVMQDDLLFPMLTVEETLMFSANVRLPQTHSRQRKIDRVKMLLEQLGLERVANTIIGDEGRRGVSGGERRRVSIGIDIVHDPLLLFLDEPTSGLDSTSAFMVVRTLQKIAQTGSIVILSIHQPSYRIMELLDRLIFLAHGQTVYNGPPQVLDSYFTAYGRSIPEHENSTEFALDLIQELNSSATGIKPLVDFCKRWKQQQHADDDEKDDVEGMYAMDVKTAIGVSISRGKLVAARAQGYDCSNSDTKVARFANPWWIEMFVIIGRSLINIRRTPELFLMRLGTVIVTGCLLATIFWNLDHTSKGVDERLGFLAFAMSTTFYTCADALPVFLQERYIFMRETAHNAYRKSSYVLANAIIFVPFLALLSIAFAVTIWWAVGLDGGVNGFVFFFLILWASFWAGNSFVTFLSAIIPNVMIGYTVVVALLAYFLLLSGFFISRDRIPKYWLWFHYLSIIKYPFEAVLMNEFGREECYERGRDIFNGTPLKDVSTGAVNAMLSIMRKALHGTKYSQLNGNTCVMTGHDILQRQHINELSKWSCLLVTLAFGVVFRFLFYIALRRTATNRH